MRKNIVIFEAHVDDFELGMGIHLLKKIEQLQKDSNIVNIKIFTFCGGGRGGENFLHNINFRLKQRYKNLKDINKMYPYINIENYILMINDIIPKIKEDYSILNCCTDLEAIVINQSKYSFIKLDESLVYVEKYSDKYMKNLADNIKKSFIQDTTLNEHKINVLCPIIKQLCLYNTDIYVPLKDLHQDHNIVNEITRIILRHQTNYSLYEYSIKNSVDKLPEYGLIKSSINMYRNLKVDNDDQKFELSLGMCQFTSEGISTISETLKHKYTEILDFEGGLVIQISDYVYLKKCLM